MTALTSWERINGAFYLEETHNGFDILAAFDTDTANGIKTIATFIADTKRNAWNKAINFATRQGIHWSGLAPEPAA